MDTTQRQAERQTDGQTDRWTDGREECRSKTAIYIQTAMSVIGIYVMPRGSLLVLVGL